MKLKFLNTLGMGLTIVLILSQGACKQETKDKVDAAGEAVMEEAGEAVESAGEAVEELVDQAEDAMVEGTKFHATGKVPCTLNGETGEGCDFGVYRIGNGTADVTITKHDGSTVVIHFQMGQVKGIDHSSEAFQPDFSVKREDDNYIITDGSDQYTIPDAVIVGG